MRGAAMKPRIRNLAFGAFLIGVAGCYSSSAPSNPEFWFDCTAGIHNVACVAPYPTHCYTLDCGLAVYPTGYSFQVELWGPDGSTLASADSAHLMVRPTAVPNVYEIDTLEAGDTDLVVVDEGGSEIDRIAVHVFRPVVDLIEWSTGLAPGSSLPDPVELQVGDTLDVACQLSDKTAQLALPIGLSWTPAPPESNPYSPFQAGPVEIEFQPWLDAFPPFEADLTANAPGCTMLSCTVGDASASRQVCVTAGAP